MHLFFVAFSPRVVSVYSSYYAGAGVVCSLLDLFAVRAGMAHSLFDSFPFVQVLACSLLYLVLGWISRTSWYCAGAGVACSSLDSFALVSVVLVFALASIVPPRRASGQVASVVLLFVSLFALASVVLPFVLVSVALASVVPSFVWAFVLPFTLVSVMLASVVLTLLLAFVQPSVVLAFVLASVLLVFVLASIVLAFASLLLVYCTVGVHVTISTTTKYRVSNRCYGAWYSPVMHMSHHCS